MVSQKNDPVSKPFVGEEATIVGPQSLNLRNIWEVLIQEWSAQTGATVRFADLPSDQDSRELVLNQDETSGGTFVLFPLNRLCEIENQLSPIPTANSEFDSRDLFKGLRERILMRDRQLVANPISVPVILCYYRKDLLAAAHLKEPETWDEYHELVASIDRWAPGLNAVEPLHPDFRATTFFARSLAFCKHPENYSVWFDLDSAKPTMDSPGFVKALEMAERTWKLLSPEVRSQTPAECRNQLLSGKAAIGLTFEPMSAELVARSSNETNANFVRADGIEIGICRLPGSRSVFNRNSKKWVTMPGKEVHAPALCGFAGLASGLILPKTKSGDSAVLNLLVSLNGPSMFDDAFSALPKGPCRESQSFVASTWFGTELSSDEASRYCDAVSLSLRDTQLVFELPVVGADEFRRATSLALDQMMCGNADVPKTADVLQKSFEEIVERIGRENVRNSQRRGLGLSALPKK